MKHETYVTNTVLVLRALAAVVLVDLVLAIFPSSGRSRRVLIRPETDSAEEQLMILALLVAVGLFWWGAGPLARWCWRGTGNTPAPGTLLVWNRGVGIRLLRLALKGSPETVEAPIPQAPRMPENHPLQP